MWLTDCCHTSQGLIALLCWLTCSACHPLSWLQQRGRALRSGPTWSLTLENHNLRRRRWRNARLHSSTKANCLSVSGSRRQRRRKQRLGGKVNADGAQPVIGDCLHNHKIKIYRVVIKEPDVMRRRDRHASQIPIFAGAIQSSSLSSKL